MRDLSSLTRDQTHAPCVGSTESQPLDRQGSPLATFKCTVQYVVTGVTMLYMTRPGPIYLITGSLSL